MQATITLQGGEGVGPDIVAEGAKVLRAVAKHFGHQFTFQDIPSGRELMQRYGSPMPRETFERAAKSDAILFGAGGGAVGTDAYEPIRIGQRSSLNFRRDLDLFANLRPVKSYAPLANASTLKPHVVRGVDYVVVREIAGGIMYSKPRYLKQTPRGRLGVNTIRYTEYELERVLRVAFELARLRRKRIHVVAQDNILESARLYRQVAMELSKEYSDVETFHILPDNCAMLIMRNPRDFDVVPFDNLTMAGMLNDEGSTIAGSLGMCPSAELHCEPDKKRGKELFHTFGLYQSIHGSVPHRAGKNQVNPNACILSAAMLLEYSLGLEREARAVEDAMVRVLEKGYRTYDIVDKVGPDGPQPQQTVVGTREMGDLIAREIEAGQ